MVLGRTPEPSKRFRSIKLPISEIDREWSRSHRTRRGAVYFGRNRTYRFDAPEGEYGVLYVGADPHVAFIESFQIAGIRPAITESKLKERYLSRIRTRGAVRLVNLADSGALTRIGADARIFTASYIVSQRWSRAIQTHPEQADGILYRPRHDPARLAAAFFDRTAERVTAQNLGAWLDQRTVLADVLDTYGVALVALRSYCRRRKLGAVVLWSLSGRFQASLAGRTISSRPPRSLKSLSPSCSARASPRLRTSP